MAIKVEGTLIIIAEGVLEGAEDFFKDVLLFLLSFFWYIQPKGVLGGLVGCFLWEEGRKGWIGGVFLGGGGGVGVRVSDDGGVGQVPFLLLVAFECFGSCTITPSLLFILVELFSLFV